MPVINAAVVRLWGIKPKHFKISFQDGLEKKIFCPTPGIKRLFSLCLSMSLFESMTHVPVPFIIEMIMIMNIMQQGGRTWQPFVGSKNGDEDFRQARIYNFRVECVVFARNRKFAKFTQWNMHYIPCNSALLALVFDPKRHFFLPKDLQKVHKSRQILIRDKIAYFRA